MPVPFLLDHAVRGAVESSRASRSRWRSKASLYPAHLAQLMVPDIYGVQDYFWGPGPATVPETAYTDDSFNYMFVGFGADRAAALVGRSWRRRIPAWPR